MSSTTPKNLSSAPKAWSSSISKSFPPAVTLSSQSPATLATTKKTPSCSTSQVSTEDSLDLRFLGRTLTRRTRMNCLRDRIRAERKDAGLAPMISLMLTALFILERSSTAMTSSSARPARSSRPNSVMRQSLRRQWPLQIC